MSSRRNPDFLCCIPTQTNPTKNPVSMPMPVAVVSAPDPRVSSQAGMSRPLHSTDGRTAPVTPPTAAPPKTVAMPRRPRVRQARQRGTITRTRSSKSLRVTSQPRASRWRPDAANNLKTYADAGSAGAPHGQQVVSFGLIELEFSEGGQACLLGCPDPFDKSPKL